MLVLSFAFQLWPRFQHYPSGTHIYMHIKLSTVTLLWQTYQMNLMLLSVSLILVVQLPVIILHPHAHNQPLLSWNNNYRKSESHHLDTAVCQKIKVPLFWRKRLPSFAFGSSKIVILFLNSLQYSVEHRLLWKAQKSSLCQACTLSYVLFQVSTVRRQTAMHTYLLFINKRRYCLKMKLCTYKYLFSCGDMKSDLGQALW